MIVTEYARLTHRDCDTDLGVHRISESTFDWLIDLKHKWSGTDSLLELENRNCLCLGSYVGYLQSPSGEAIEILPKIYSGDDPDKLRNILKKMLECLFNIRSKNAGSAQLDHIKLPIHELIFRLFLSELTTLLRKGLKLDYTYVEEERKYIRGRLDIVKQLRQAPDRQANFHIRYDVYSVNRLENRLIKSALNCILKLSKDPENRRIATEYSHLLHEIAPYHDAADHIAKWSSARDMRVYQPIRPWCEIILSRLNPAFHKGKYHGIALLFPMEKLFEAYVTYHMKIRMPTIQSQAGHRYLATHKNQKYFQLRPDLLLHEARIVIDIKWKQIFANSNTHNYGINREDVRQMFAYGHKYIGGEGNAVLIYPKHEGFTEPLDCFHLDEENGLNLWVVPFDLETDSLVGNMFSKELK